MLYEVITRELAPPRMGIHWISLRLERAVFQGVVQPDAGAGNHDATPKQLADGLCSGDDVAVAIGHDEMRCMLARLTGTGRIPEGFGRIHVKLGHSLLV